MSTQQFRQCLRNYNNNLQKVVLQDLGKCAQQPQQKICVELNKKHKEMMIDPQIIYSLGFAQDFRQFVLLNRTSKTDCQPKRQNQQLWIKDEEMQPQRTLDKHFKRNRFNQKCAQECRENNNQRKFIDWDNLTQSQVFNIGLPRAKRVKVSSQDLLSLKSRKNIPKSIVGNFFTLLEQSGRMNQSVAIQSFSFLPTLLQGIDQDEKKQQNIIQIVKRNYQKASKCLRVPLLQKKITAIPFIVYHHYFMVIIKGAPKLLTKKDQTAVLVYCSSRFTADKTIFLALKTYISMELEVIYKKGLKVSDKNIQCTQLILPKQMYSADSGLFLMLYCQFLLADGCKQLDDVKSNHYGPKLHLFPLNLVEEMRAILWNFYYKLIHAKEKEKQTIIEEYFSEKKGCVTTADPQHDYSDLDLMEVRKLQILIKGEICQNEEERFLLTLEYFYSSNLNYYIDP